RLCALRCDVQCGPTIATYVDPRSRPRRCTRSSLPSLDPSSCRRWDVLAVQLKPNPRLTLEELEGIAPYGATTRWPAGFAIYERLAPADGIFVVRSGQ